MGLQNLAGILQRWTLVLALLAIAFSLRAQAAIEAHDFDNDVQRQRYQSFIEEMRCPKCQNQNLAGSDSPISADLREKLYEMIKQGKSDKEIVDYMVDRYGDFILYRPRVSPVTYVLWITPGALLLIGIIVLVVMLRRGRRRELERSLQPLNDDEQHRLQSLLNENAIEAPAVNAGNRNSNKGVDKKGARS